MPLKLPSKSFDIKIGIAALIGIYTIAIIGLAELIIDYRVYDVPNIKELCP